MYYLMFSLKAGYKQLKIEAFRRLLVFSFGRSFYEQNYIKNGP